MKRKKNKVLQETNGREEMSDEMLERLIQELSVDHDAVLEVEEKIKQHKKKFRRSVIISAALIILVVVGSYLLIHLQTYTAVRTINNYKNSGAGNNSYKQYADGVLKYSRDGIAFLNQQGKEVWNQPYQIKNPVIVVNKEAMAVADKGGNDIMVFNKAGLRGEIYTTLPIEKMAVSANGIISVILKNDASPQIVCYDAAGNVLAEQKISVAGLGYPLDISMSANGEVLMASYMGIQNGKPISRVQFYNFGKAGEEKTDRQVAAADYENKIVPAVFFMNQDTSAAVGDDCVLIYKGEAVPELKVTIPVKKAIKSMAYNSRYIALVLKNEGQAGYELCLYNTAGKKVLSEEFSGDYSNIKVCQSQVILYDRKKSLVFTRNGICKFEGEMNSSIAEIFPIVGVNKYIVMNANGMEVVRFVK